MTYSWWKSPAVISFILMFIAGGVQAVSSAIPSTILTIIMGALALAGSYFHVSLANSLGAKN